MRSDGKRTSTFVIEQSLPDERLDSFLRGQFPAVSRVTLKRLIEQGDIRVDGHPVKPTHHPRHGEKIEVRWPEPKPSNVQPEEIPLDILYEDEDLLVLNKAPGLVIHPAAGHEKHTLVNALLHHCEGQLSGIGGVARPGIVHRLDKDTSGCLVVAKNDPTHIDLAKQLCDVLGAELAASRPICDSGWLPMERQVGSSGQTVAPKLYLALGISGAIQHLVGMKGSRCVVAVNKDSNAPIFEVADYGIVGNLFDVVPALIEELRKVKG